ncbi:MULTISPECIES: efflux RND transporter periplasmic adaptor subunit [unclassified Methylobacterium]|uniref:efflux RND transporter periplasmic adaptor subunit n=1 Tax=unclassified Methylobacterium TaxID=2615210 RepID=UPI0006FF3FF3|nr:MULTISPECIES: efflux RND transporter periplasmic adaptor subunit [unclassified Methylobacterium]KQP15524.1 cation transporter [Methylobacterium sp. Leaf93]TXN41158.1 efflux RND transporter periplasmic adaptor subunit [Methylobacterium sp. WL93]TXN51438.1 efflux RND transporter periplasmic adaptor subunit [Methylobacterium sp. WL119]TXN67694.1 efflux RND transporter periplasmic adaptor subunit [Methylobacterium sp. WL30]
MLRRLPLVLLAVAGGFLVATWWPAAPDAVRALVARARPAATVPSREPTPAAAPEPEHSGLIRLTDAQIAKAGIRTDDAGEGRLARHLHVPGTIVPSADNTARIAVKTTGTVVELRKGLGDRVAKGEVVALIESREIAETKGEYLAARLSAALQKTLYERDKELWDRRISSEQQYLRSQASYQDLKVKEDAARRKLSFLGLGPAEIDALPTKPQAQFERQEIRSPIAGRIVERRVDLGAAVGRDNLETELYSVVDLSKIWIDLAVSPGDLPLVHEGQEVTFRTEATGAEARGRIVFIGPVLDQNTRAARVVAELANPQETWRPGSFVSAEIVISDKPVRVLLPTAAIQTLEGKPNVFVRVVDGFEARPVTLGRSDDESVEVTAGLEPGEAVAVANSFTLKAELGKSAAED